MEPGLGDRTGLHGQGRRFPQVFASGAGVFLSASFSGWFKGKPKRPPPPRIRGYPYFDT